jgi:hypothetical protein
MDVICLLVAGVVRATLPGPDFTLAWQHSVEKAGWEEHYRADDGHLLLVDARIAALGAGMEPPAGAVLHEGRWSWQPLRIEPELRLTYSTYTPDYRLCSRDTCRDLGAMVGPSPEGTVVVVRPCA